MENPPQLNKSETNDNYLEILNIFNISFEESDHHENLIK